MDRSLNSGAKGRGFGTTFRPSLKLVMKEEQQQQHLEERRHSRRRNYWRRSSSGWSRMRSSRWRRKNVNRVRNHSKIKILSLLIEKY